MGRQRPGLRFCPSCEEGKPAKSQTREKASCGTRKTGAMCRVPCAHTYLMTVSPSVRHLNAMRRPQDPACPTPPRTPSFIHRPATRPLRVPVTPHLCASKPPTVDSRPPHRLNNLGMSQILPLGPDSFCAALRHSAPPSPLLSSPLLQGTRRRWIPCRARAFSINMQSESHRRTGDAGQAESGR